MLVEDRDDTQARTGIDSICGKTLRWLMSLSLGRR
jgi:hypothetical protein